MSISNLGEFSEHPTIRDNAALRRVLAVFDGISSHARPSKGEAQVRAHLIELAESQGWGVEQDEMGNVAFKVPATAGREGVTPVILQGHMDIVVTDKDRYLPRVAEIVDQGQEGEEKGLWMQTKGRDMTLGSDNGIGVSLATAAMMDPDLEHGPVTILMTVDEETGMTGAKGLDPKLLPETGILINLDSEEGPMDICIGCAGSADMVVKFPFGEMESLPEGYVMAELTLKGFPGGHSGIMIHTANGNAIQSLALLLNDLREAGDLRLLSINGGSARNAIPNEARAMIALPMEDAGKMEAIVDVFLDDLKMGEGVEDELMSSALSAEKAKSVTVEIKPVNAQSQAAIAEKVMMFSREFQAEILTVLALVQTGPFSSAVLPNVGNLVTLSNNLGLVKTKKDGVEVVSMARGANIEALRAKIAEIKALFLDCGGTVNAEEPTSGWLEDPEASPAVKMAVAAVDAVMGEHRFLAYHAGLEAGLVSGKRPGALSGVAVGPLILEAHTPRERVSLDSVAAEIGVLKNLLANVVG